MKKIGILRHAKTQNPMGVDDHDRPLTDGGQKHAEMIAEYLKSHHLKPDLILCSSAIRTKQTAKPIQCIEIDVRKDLYLAGTGGIYEAIKNVDDNVHFILVIGHNPGMHQIALFLAGEGAPEHLRDMELSYPTGTLSIFDCDVENWEDVMPSQNKLVHFVMKHDF